MLNGVFKKCFKQCVAFVMVLVNWYKGSSNLIGRVLKHQESRLF